jgi:phospholipid/cholesterol/gamma-HCH transport system substrate-binding protein
MSAKSVGRPLLGLLFVVVILAGLVLAVMVYQKKFTPVVMVQLTTDSIGNQLLPQSDVKLNGLIVGEVRSISDSDGKAKLALALDPDKTPLIPSNVTARFLPKTLFGEKYVALVMPDNRDTPITGGDMIKQDTSQATVEVQRVLDDLLPLLRAVPPQELSATLGAMAQALDGRGKQLGQNLTQLNTLVSSLNKQLPALKADISGLADFSDIYTAATPDLLSALANLTTTTNTVVDQRSNLDNLYSTLTGTSANLTGFLNANGANIIRLSTDSTSTLQVLARYAPDYQCTFENFTKLIPNINQAVGAGTDRPGLRLKLEVTKSRGKYIPNQDEPNITDNRGPRCYPIVDPKVGNFPQYPGGPVADGSAHPPSSNPDYQASALPLGATGLGLAGSTAEQGMLASIFSQTTGTAPEQVPGWSALVAAPALRGHEVTVQ